MEFVAISATTWISMVMDASQTSTYTEITYSVRNITSTFNRIENYNYGETIRVSVNDSLNGPLLEAYALAFGQSAKQLFTLSNDPQNGYVLNNFTN
jgi:ABC-type uncharacterized transport system permease subunit